MVIQPYSANARKVYRDVNTDEWQAILAWLTRIGMQGVVLNKGGEEAIASRKLIDLSNRTTLYQAIRIVNGATAYAGTSSCFSVLAARRLPENRLLIKGHPSLKEKWHRIYYAPSRVFLAGGLPAGRFSRVSRAGSSWRRVCRRVGFRGYRGQGGLVGGGGLTQPQC